MRRGVGGCVRDGYFEFQLCTPMWRGCVLGEYAMSLIDS